MGQNGNQTLINAVFFFAGSQSFMKDGNMYTQHTLYLKIKQLRCPDIESSLKTHF